MSNGEPKTPTAALNDQAAEESEGPSTNSENETLTAFDVLGNGATNSESDGRNDRSAESKALKTEQKWEEHFKKLVVFKKRFGHCLVPNRYNDDFHLGSWVSTQRRYYKILLSGTSASTPMTAERAKRLTQLGFSWATKDPRHVPWDNRYQELVVFVREYGHTQVPIGWQKNTKLANWVSTQRQEFKLLQKGRSSRLTQDRIDKLNAIDFVWEAQRGGPRRGPKACTVGKVSEKANPIPGVGPRSNALISLSTKLEAESRGCTTQTMKLCDIGVGIQQVPYLGRGESRPAPAQPVVLGTLSVAQLLELQQAVEVAQRPWQVLAHGGCHQGQLPLPLLSSKTVSAQFGFQPIPKPYESQLMPNEPRNFQLPRISSSNFPISALTQLHQSSSGMSLPPNIVNTSQVADQVLIQRLLLDQQRQQQQQSTPTIPINETVQTLLRDLQSLTRSSATNGAPGN